MAGFLTINQVRILKQAVYISLTGAGLGVIYVIFSDGFGSIFPFINGFIGGFLIGVMVAVLELYYFKISFHRFKFLTIIILRLLFYIVLITFIIINVLVISRMIRYDLTYIGVLRSEEFINFVRYKDFLASIIFSVVFALGVNFTRMISRKMGQGVLLSFLTGTYQQPLLQERIFMFLSINHSRKISERQDLRKFFDFLNDVFYDITESIVIHQGIIYEYVDDQVVISWNKIKGLRNGNCIRAFFHMNTMLEEKKEYYFNQYGFFPALSCGIHMGEIVRAEVGDIKSEIVFHGDTINTTARIHEQCFRLGKQVLISKDVFHKLDLPLIYKSENCGEIALKGKSEPMELIEISEKKVKDLPPLPKYSSLES